MERKEFVERKALYPTEITCDNCGMTEMQTETFYGFAFCDWIRFQTRVYDGNTERNKETYTYCCVDCLIEDIQNKDLKGDIKIPTIARRRRTK